MFHLTRSSMDLSLEKRYRSDGRRQLQYWTCGKDNLQKDCPQNQGGIPQSYSAQEAQIVGDVGKRIPRIYASLENKEEDHKESIIQMDNNICDQVVSIFIDPRYNYSYVNPYLVDKCDLNKEVHAKYWLVKLDTCAKKEFIIG